MNGPLNIVLPLVGTGDKLNAFTSSRPPALIEIAGNPLIKHVLAMFATLPPTLPRTFIFITRAKDRWIRSWMESSQPSLKSLFIDQDDSPDPAHALYQIRAGLSGPILLLRPDRWIDTDLAFLGDFSSTAICWVRTAAGQPFGGQWVHTDRRRILKIDHQPPISGERIAPAGLYYFPDSHALVDAVEEIFVNELQENDYSINEAINILIDRGFSVQAEAATALHDTGSTKSLLELNAHLLVGGHANFTSRADADGATIVPPVYIAPSARVSASIVGPHVSIGAGCRIDGSVLRSSIIGEKTIVTGCDLRDSFTGANAYLSGVSGIITVGDNAAVTTGALNG